MEREAKRYRFKTEIRKGQEEYESEAGRQRWRKDKDGGKTKRKNTRG